MNLMPYIHVPTCFVPFLDATAYSNGKWNSNHCQTEDDYDHSRINDPGNWRKDGNINLLHRDHQILTQFQGT